jgi:23S rRNA pseudouridine1911/1915/1917 synthase
MNQHAKRRHQALRAGEGSPKAAPAPAAPRPAPPVASSGLTRDGGEMSFAVEAGHTGLRLDRFLFDRLAEAGELMSRTRLKTLIETGFVAVDGAVTADPAAKTRESQHVRLTAPAAAAAEPAAENIPLSVIYEDEHLIVVDKPAGLVVHPAASHETGTLVNALIAHCGDSLSGIGGVKRPGIVHRLDKGTSGLLVMAKNDPTHLGLAQLFADHGRTLGLVREYRALVWGAPDRTAGLVDAPIGRHPQARDKQAVVRRGGREAITHWRIERVFKDAAGGALASLLACRLETGRTHQIRVHMASIGCPILGDPLYAAGFKTKAARLQANARAALAAMDRQALHAAVLGFPHPITGEELLFQTPAPEDMARLIRALESPTDAAA